MSLALWGWNSFFENAWRYDSSAEPARVQAINNNYCTVITEAGECEARVSYCAPAVGDWVALRGGVVEDVLPRRTQVSRRAAGRRVEEQVLAANVDRLFIVCGLDGDYHPRRLERYRVMAAAAGIDALCVLTKADLTGERPEPPMPFLHTSTVSGEGLQALAAALRPGQTGALIGSSGAGKSTLINSLLGAPVQAVGDGRPIHVTTRRHLFRLPTGGLLIDNPGLREIQIWAGAGDVDAAFEDVATLAAGCRFRDCRHLDEPGCAVRGAVDTARLANYQKLQRETERLSEDTDLHLRLQRKRKLKAIHKAARAFFRER